MQLKKKEIDNQDIMYVAGAVLVVIGVSLHNLATGFVTGGVFLLFAPVLTAVQGFIRGIKQ